METRRTRRSTPFNVEDKRLKDDRQISVDHDLWPNQFCRDRPDMLDLREIIKEPILALFIKLVDSLEKRYVLRDKFLWDRRQFCRTSNKS